MAACDCAARFESLELPEEFDDLEGLLQADMRAIVTMLVERANERLFLTRREHLQLQSRLWNGLTGAINESLEPLSAEYR